MDKIIKIAMGLFIVVVLVCAVFFVITRQAADTPAPGRVTVYFFYGEECQYCHNVMPVVESLRQKYPDVDFQIRETYHNQTNQALSVSLNQKLGIPNPGVPEVIVGKLVLVGDRDIPAKLESVILGELKKSGN